jgi:hypothetical protein
MKFITSEKIEQELRRIGMRQVLVKYGRHRIAPGFTVADYVKIGEFYRTAGRHLPRENWSAEACPA